MAKPPDLDQISQLVRNHPIFTSIVFVVGIIIGWNIRPIFENDVVDLVSTLTAEQWLVLVTVGYAVLTYKLVRETKLSREQDRNRTIQRNNREKESLRRVLLAEIEQNLDKLDSIDTTHNNISFGGDVFYSDIYLQNTDNIGVLTLEESRAVVEAFTELTETQRLIRTGLKTDDRHGIGSTAIAKSRIGRIRPKMETAKGAITDHLGAGPD
jgi:hypothetical protein